MLFQAVCTEDNVFFQDTLIVCTHAVLHYAILTRWGVGGGGGGGGAFHLLIFSCKILWYDFYQYPFLVHLACLSQLTNEVHTSVKISGKSAIFPSS